MSEEKNENGVRLEWKMVPVEPELKWMNNEKRLPCREWVNWFRDKNGCSLRHAVDVGLARLRAAPSTAAPQPPAPDEPHPVGDTHFEVSPNAVVRAAFAQGYETGRAHGKVEQPPALGGEPEVIYMLRNTALNTPWRDADKAAFDCAAGLVEYERRELVDRAHVARLQADFDKRCDSILEELGSERDRLQAEVERLNAMIAELAKDKDRLDSLEANYWDVRYSSSPIADTGDHSTSVEIVGRWMDKPHERVIGENYNENLRAAIDQAMSADAYPPERPEYPEIDAALAGSKEHE